MRRHSVFFNFMWTYLMYTAVMIFTNVVLYMAFTQTGDETIGVDMILNTLVNSMRLVALTATLNLVIHLWFQMRGAFSDAKAWTTKLRTFAVRYHTFYPEWMSIELRQKLLVTPYLMGIVPLVSFWELSFRHAR
ncbi:hypothetical protein JB92DRAFT_2909636 [Gautieria morchelliformis]|nr:hypothetical protein JB92DRAFT_2909636 [Gautieria morchelliformis]